LAIFVNIKVSTINGEFLETPQSINFDCGSVVGVGMDRQILRGYDANWCIVAKKVYLIRQGQNVYGTDFQNKNDFQQFINSNCYSAYFLIDGCIMTLNGCEVKI
jgi:hypothetical protein